MKHEVILVGRNGESLRDLDGPSIEEGSGMLLWKHTGKEEVVVRGVTVKKSSGEEVVYDIGQRLVPGQSFRLEGSVLSAGGV